MEEKGLSLAIGRNFFVIVTLCRELLCPSEIPKDGAVQLHFSSRKKSSVRSRGWELGLDERSTL